MAFKLGDRVRETSTTTGTGVLSLAGAAVGYQSFASVLANGDTCWYAAAMGPHWEVGLGTFAIGSPATLTRTTVMASSNGGAAVDFPAGDKDVFITAPAEALEGLAGISPIGRSLMGAADAAAVRSISGQKWAAVYDQTLGAAVAAIDIPLTGGFSRYRLIADIVPANLGNFDVQFRISKDGGATYEAGAGSYTLYGRIDFGGATAHQPSADFTLGALAPVFNSSFPQVGCDISADIRQGSVSRRLGVTSRARGFSPTDFYLSEYGTTVAAAGAATHLRILGNLAGNIFAAGSRVILEGC